MCLLVLLTVGWRRLFVCRGRRLPSLGLGWRLLARLVLCVGAWPLLVFCGRNRAGLLIRRWREGRRRRPGLPALLHRRLVSPLLRLFRHLGEAASERIGERLAVSAIECQIGIAASLGGSREASGPPVGVADSRLVVNDGCGLALARFKR